MRGRFTTPVLLLALVGLVPATAHAQAYFTPMAGVTFGKDAPAAKFTTGAGLAFLGKGAGFEIELGYTPDFFNQQGEFAIIADSNLTTFSGTLLVGLGEARVRPYGAIGLGLIRSRVEETDLFDAFTTNETGFNVGGGAFVTLTEHVGVRGDLRYFRSLKDPTNDDDLDVSIGNFDFWRATGALTLKF